MDYFDELLPDQKANFADSHPELLSPEATGSRSMLTPTSQTQGGGSMQVPPVVPNDQTVQGSGDLAAGEFEPQVGSRTPTVKGLPDERYGQIPPFSH